MNDRPPASRIAAVLIGRNEGARLIRCLASVQGTASRMIYVDSGSSDGSVAAAKGAGAEVVTLDLTQPFTAARARNAGLAQLMRGDVPDYIQFVDGDCEVQPGWIAVAHGFLQATPRAAVACGRRRERFPDASVYNRLCDREWDTPIGQTRSCGGDALIRLAALADVGGYNPNLIAGEEPELCVRLRGKGWQVWRLDHEMTLHDAAMTRFGQWWNRSRRAGHAYAEGAALHGAAPERLGVSGLRRALAWGLALPLIAVAGSLASPWTLILFIAWPAQILRLATREGFDRAGWQRAFFLVLGKIPESFGALEYWLRRLVTRPAGLIEYK